MSPLPLNFIRAGIRRIFETMPENKILQYTDVPPDDYRRFAARLDALVPSDGV